MVSKTRKGTRKSKRSSSRKSLKGGAFNSEPGKYLRRSGWKSGNKILYELEYSTENGNSVYKLDFTKSDIGFVLSKIMDGDRFSTVLKKALNSTNDNDNANITGIVYALFDGGADKAKTRIMKITESTDSVNIELISASDNNTIMTATVTAAAGKMSDFLAGLGDEIMPNES
jgi:hypothetical protein